MMQRRWLPAWRANGYGICTGNTSPLFEPEADPAKYEGLTPWMHGVIQRTAGRTPDAPPLTFGDLWGAPAKIGDPAAAVSSSSPRSIELAMMLAILAATELSSFPFSRLRPLSTSKWTRCSATSRRRL
jgi:hypothetical protein